MPYLLIALTFALGMAQVTAASITFDEGPHLAIGYATLRTRDLRLQPVHIHPPLANVLAAAPLLLQRDLPHPAQIDGWEIASLSAITDSVVWSYPHPRHIATAGRVPILLLGILTGALVFRWARDLGGWRAGLLALGLYALDPNAIAHSALITTDAGAVLLSVATLYALHRWLSAREGSGKQLGALVAAGTILGLAQLTKVSALMLLPVAALILLTDAWARRRHLGTALRWAALQMGLLVGIAALVLWAGYGFELRPVAGLPVSLPAATHIEILRSLSEHYDLGHPTFALGRVSTHGWPWYFPLAFGLKTPLPVLLLTVAAALTVGRSLRRFVPRIGPADLKVDDARSQSIFFRENRAQAAQVAALGFFPLLYAGTSLFSTVNIGYRHLLPILPFLYITIGIILTREYRHHPRHRLAGQLVLGGLVIWLAAGTLSTLPYPLTFFNELAGGPAGGHHALVDSNLDWGQNLWDLADWMDAHDRDHVTYAHYSPARPEAYGVNADFLPPDPRAVPFAPWHPAPGLYAIGATVLQGPYAPDLNTYAWFRDRVPVARLGNALFLYEVEARPAPAWAVVCPATLDASAVRRLVGVPDLRGLQPDCSRTRVYPASQTPGLVVLPGQATSEEPGDRLLSLRDADGSIYATVQQVSHDSVMPEVVLTYQIDSDGPASFLGHRVATSQDAVAAPVIHLWTYWEVLTLPDRPLSLMAHLVAPDGATLAVGDGLGFPIEQWRVGDLIVQQHHLELPDGVSAEGDLSAEIGGYWLDTMERWRTSDGGDSIRIDLTGKP